MPYEMQPGQRPFAGEPEHAHTRPIGTDDPAPRTGLRTGIPLELERVVRKAMAKDPGERYQHVEDLLVDLKAIGRDLESGEMTRTAGSLRTIGTASSAAKWKRVLAAAAVVIAGAAAVFLWNASRTPSGGTGPAGGMQAAQENRPSIAVLPFLDMSPERDQEYFCEGMAEELINALTQLGGLKVSARTSSFQFKGAGHDIREVGHDLGVETILEGSVRKAGSRLRITAQLINVADGSHLWSETFDRNLDDIFAIQDEISLAIVEQLRPELLGEKGARLAERATGNPEAYNLYLRGRWFWNKRTPPDLMRGIEHFTEAIQVSPDYALAYAGMADCYTALAEYSVSPPEGVAQAAREAALKALELDDTLPEAHAANGYIKIVYDWDWRGAETDFRRATELDPYYAPAHHRYAALLSIMGRYEEGLVEIRQAQALEPHTPSISVVLALLLCNVGQLDLAVEELERALEVDPGFHLARITLGTAHMYAGRFDLALAAFREQDRLMGGQSPHATALIGAAQALSGNVEEAESALAEVMEASERRPVSSSLVAVLCFLLDRKDEGFEWLEEAYEERDLLLRMMIPIFRRPDMVGDDPRFTDLMGRMGLGS